MNDAHLSAPGESSIPEKAYLTQWHDEAEAAAADESNLRDRVRDLTARALHEREIVGAITAGVGSGLASRGGEMKEGLKQAVSGLDEAVSSAAQKASYTLREAADQGRAFKDNELKTSLEQLRDLEFQFVDTLKQTASQSGGKLKEELDILSEHMRNSGTRTGEQVREAFQQLVSGVKSTTETSREKLGESTSAATDRLSEVASGVLAAVSDALKRQSDRLRH